MRAAHIIFVSAVLAACGAESPPELAVEPSGTAEARPEIYAEFTLTTDLSFFNDEQREMLGLLIQASQIMDDLFWQQTYGEGYEEWLGSIGVDEVRLFAEQNYGPWDRLDDEKPFIEGVGPKPLGANFYPADMSKEEFDAAYLPGKDDLYTLIRRDEQGALILVPFHVEYAEELKAASQLLHQAADLAVSQDFANYLKLRANALISDDFQLSDMYWMDVDDNEIDVVIGPIETYEDRLFGYKAAYESYVLIKDLEWSARLAKFATFLPELQEGLPVPDEYKQESPGSDSDLNAYDVIYYAGHSNMGGKTIAINLPNDEEVQLQKGTRRLQLKNVMKAKFEKILEPIADVLVDDSQREHISFDAFFANTMFHEVAHGLGRIRSLARELFERQCSTLRQSWKRAKPTSLACTWSVNCRKPVSSVMSICVTTTLRSWRACFVRFALVRAKRMARQTWCVSTSLSRTVRLSVTRKPASTGLISIR